MVSDKKKRELADAMVAAAYLNDDPYRHHGTEMMQDLIEKGADPRASTQQAAGLFDVGGEELIPATPLMMSCAAGKMDCALYLLGLGQRCNPHAPMPLGQSLVVLAFLNITSKDINSWRSLVSLFVDNKFSLTAPSASHCYTPLVASCASGNLQAVTALLEKLPSLHITSYQLQQVDLAPFR